MPQTILVINSGSSSIKYQLVDPSIGVAMASGLVERIGEEMSTIHHRYSLKEVTINEPVPNHEAALQQVLDLFEEIGPQFEEAHIVGIGHRIVQGGRYFSGPTLIDDRVKRLIGELSSLAPLHNPPALKGIEVCQKLLPGIPNVAVFDTAFFQKLPNSSALYALDRDVAERYSIRRYGAHGTSHQYVSTRVTQVLGDKELKQIVLHLGNGASASAIVSGRAVDTSMGLTPLEGLVMGTRTGDIDPAVVFHLQRVANMSVSEVDNLFNKKSGLRGLAGDNDMRAVREMARSGNPRAREALEIYINRLVKYIGGYAAEMGGVDVITFTAGIGENDIDLRREVCQRLEFFGVILDEEANNTRPREATTISRRDSSVRVMVVPTNEELAIATQAMTLV
ncbi:acetate kinase [Scrofimicrobium sp. R131]|uniref:Acetate kinase n=1 Tax=Scrofimicrobium appendicitidis TaxID=3079930 RepID=A0AAU7V5R2_9ACTO